MERPSIWDVFGSIELDKPLIDVQELRDQYREMLIKDDENYRIEEEQERE